MGYAFLECCAGKYIMSQAVIHGHHLSLGATERRHRHCMGIVRELMCQQKLNNVADKGQKESPPMCTLRWIPQVLEYGGFSPGRSVFFGAGGT